jgi:methionyl-tRNA formyltransferase
MLPTEPIGDQPLRVVFMGSPTWAVPCLQRLLDGPDEVVGVYCQPDKRAGRGRIFTPPPIGLCANDLCVPLYQPRGLRKPEVIEELAALRPDLIVVVAYGKILPPAVLALPRHGCINVHFSLLPAWRGAAPVQYAIIAGDDECGVTTMLMDEGMDTGPTLLKAPEPIRADDTTASLGERLTVLGADLLAETMDQLRAGTLVASPQDDAQASHARLLSKDVGQLDWTRPAVELERLVRGTFPWPGAFTFRDGKRVKVLRARLADPAAGVAPGTLVDAGRTGVTVACGEGALSLVEVQPEGKRKMDAPSFVNGFRVQPGEVWG